MGATEQLMVDYAASLRFEDLPAEVVHHAKRRVIDTLAGALAAYTAPPAQMARRLALPVRGHSGARVWGSLVRTTPDLAAFANGVMLRYLDINDTHRTLDGSHPSDNLGGILAVAETVGAGGRAFLEALVISYEIQCRFVDSVPFNDAGWDQPVPGVMAGALAAGRLLGLEREQLGHALALAIIPNLCTYQTRAGELSMWKGCAAANGARQAVFAALLAGQGMTGPFEAFDGVFGLWQQTMGKPYEIKPFATPTNGLAFGITQTNLKKYPVRDSCQLPADAARHLRTKIAASDIATLRIDTYRSAYQGAAEDPELWAPKTRETADHSMPVTVAVMLIDGSIAPDTFSGERFKAPDVLDLIQRTKIEVADEFTQQAPGMRNCRIVGTGRDGREHVAHLKWTAADIARGMSDEELEDKVAKLTRDVLTGPYRRALLDLLWNLEKVPNVAALVDRLAL
ncbi:MAG: MmgE/PrpD family protein [Pseudomonadota bacterium]